MSVYEDVNLTILKHLENTCNLQVLDVGCGTGSLGKLLRKNGNYVEGITISEEEAEIDRQMKALFSRGHKPEINQLLSKLESNKKLKK